MADSGKGYRFGSVRLFGLLAAVGVLTGCLVVFYLPLIVEKQIKKYLADEGAGKVNFQVEDLSLGSIRFSEVEWSNEEMDLVIDSVRVGYTLSGLRALRAEGIAVQGLEFDLNLLPRKDSSQDSVTHDNKGNEKGNPVDHRFEKPRYSGSKFPFKTLIISDGNLSDRDGVFERDLTFTASLMQTGVSGSEYDLVFLGESGKDVFRLGGWVDPSEMDAHLQIEILSPDVFDWFMLYSHGFPDQVARIPVKDIQLGPASLDAGLEIRGGLPDIWGGYLSLLDLSFASGELDCHVAQLVTGFQGVGERSKSLSFNGRDLRLEAPWGVVKPGFFFLDWDVSGSVRADFQEVTFEIPEYISATGDAIFDIDLPQDGVGEHFRGNFAFKEAELKGTGLLPLQLSAEGDLQKMRIEAPVVRFKDYSEIFISGLSIEMVRDKDGSLSLNAQSTFGDTDFPLVIRQQAYPNPESSLDWDWRGSISGGPGPFNLSILSKLRKLFDLPEGITLSGDVEFIMENHSSNSGQNLSGWLQIKDGVIASAKPEIYLGGLHGRIDLSFNPETGLMSRGRLEIAELSSGSVLIENLVLDLDHGEKGEIWISHLSGLWCGGKVEFEPFSFNKSNSAFRTNLILSAIRMEKVLELWPSFQGKIKGPVSGRIPLERENNRMVVGYGLLQMLKGITGAVEYENPGWLTTGLNPGSPQHKRLVLAEESMRDMILNSLEIALFSPDFPDTEARVHLMGTGKGKHEGDGIDLTINLKVPLQDINYFLTGMGYHFRLHRSRK